MMSSGMHMSSSRVRTIVCPTGVIIQAGALATPTGKTIVAGHSNREGRSLLRWDWAVIVSSVGADVETVGFRVGWSDCRCKASNSCS